MHSLSKQVENLQASQERSNTRIQMLKQSIRELEEGKKELLPNTWVLLINEQFVTLFLINMDENVWVCVCQESVS